MGGSAGAPTLHCDTLPEGGGAAHANMPPWLALRYLVAFEDFGDVVAGQVSLSAGENIPAGWVEANGQLLLQSQYPELHAALGTTFGGGEGTFALPDLQGRVPLHAGQGNGLSDRALGAKGGVESVALTAAQMPPHVHGVVDTDAADHCSASDVP